VDFWVIFWAGQTAGWNLGLQWTYLDLIYHQYQIQLLPPIDRFKQRIFIWARMNRILGRT
jgi:hypothetical protein